jgi:putative transposase
MLELISADEIQVGRKKKKDYVKFRTVIKEDWLDTLRETKERRKSQICKVYEVKVDKSHLNNETENQLKMLSLEAKWYCNHIRSKIQYGKNQESLFDLDYKIDKVAVKVGCRYEIRELKYLSSQMKQELLDRIKDDVIRLSEKKKKGHTVGKLKFKSDIRSVPLKQYGNTYKILDNKYITIQGVKQKIRVRGLNQILDRLDHNNENIEVANADFINKHGDFYLHIVTYQDKKVVDMPSKEIKEPKSIGLDFGIAEQITLSNGVRINYRIPISNKLRKLYKKLGKQEYHSNNWEKTRLKIRKEFDKLTNIKEDIKNKIVHRLGEYQIVCYQDDNIKSWQRIWGRRILETSIGEIKSDIDKKIQTPVEIDRFFPSTKKCSECGHEREIGLDERIYECLNPKCQIKKDRDWNSSINIEGEGLRNIRVDTGRIDFKTAEIGSSTLDMEYFNRIPYVKASSVRETGSLTALA